MIDLRAKYGRYALVTGASSGIGAEFAAQLADTGFDLVVVARRRDRLEALADKLQSRTGRHVFVAPADLAAPGAVDDLMRQTSDLDIGLVVAAAGVMVAGKFVDNDYFAETATVQVNVLALMQLTQRFGAAMARRGRGALILVASTVGHAAVPYTANYAASKAYVSSLGRALHYELKPAGVDVLTLAPGPTDTEGFHDAEGIDFTALPMPVMPTESVVRFALKKLGRRALVIPGVMNRFADRLGKFVIPSSWMTALFGRMLAKATALAGPTPVAIRGDQAS
ncbi:SDR family NAD(P)-dependent oxidoreductase [Mycobacterium sp. MUNTM1]